MNRRKFIQLGLTASAGLITAGSLAGPVALHAPARPKRGLGLGIRSAGPWRKKLQQSGAQWFYTWGPEAPQSVPDGIEFVPMIWGRTGVEMMAAIPEILKQQGSTELLGFNEPDRAEQSNLTVEMALELWPGLMQLGLPLGAPGCASVDGDWIKSFMKGVKERKLRVDFMTVHSYGDLDVDHLMNHLAKVHDTFQLPLWLTEFAVGDWNAKTRADNRYQPDHVVQFIHESLPRLDRCDFVSRYAWFPAQPDDRALGPCALFNADGSLTPVGQAYSTV